MTRARILRNGLLLTGQLGCNRVEVNSVFMNVIEVMKEGGYFLGLAATIYEEFFVL
jgi:hypothetical protein